VAEDVFVRAAMPDALDHRRVVQGIRKDDAAGQVPAER
jgi:hypothetical protein